MKKSKKLIFVALLSILMLVLAACGGDKEAGGEKSDSAKGSGDTVTIKFAHSAVEANSRHTAALKFKEIVEEKSNGTIEVEVFPNEVLGSEPQMVEAVTFDDIQMVASSTFAQYEPKIDLFGLPFLFDSNEEAWEVLDGPIGQEIHKSLIDDNLHVLGHLENGFRNITTNDKPIKTVADLKGLKIRTPEQPILVDIFKTLGANPTPMAFGELYMALQQGTVDGQENPISNIHASKFYEVQKYLTLSGHSYSQTTMAMSENFWQSLTEEQQKIVQDAATEVSKFHRELVKEDEAKLLEDLKAKGMEVVTPDKEEFKKASMKVYDAYADKYGKEIVDELLEATK